MEVVKNLRNGGILHTLGDVKAHVVFAECSFEHCRNSTCKIFKSLCLFPEKIGKKRSFSNPKMSFGRLG